jgi:negative regulator of sigma E activity
MFKQISTQATAFGFAALVTLATLGGLQQLATSHDAAHPVAGAEAPAQQVVVIGQRQPRG